MIVLLSPILAVAVACGPAPQTAAGFVVDVQSTSLTQIDSFTIRTQEGEALRFRVGAVDLDGGAFPPSHLREHMATAQPVAVAFTREGDERIATRLVDAPWLRP